MIIHNKILKKFLSPYSSNAKYLRLARDNWKNKKISFGGNFRIEKSVYVSKEFSSGHLNMIDLLICYNQLLFVGIADKLQKKSLKLEKLTYQTFRENKLNGLIYFVEDAKIRKPINTEYFFGNIEIERITLRNNTYFAKTNYNFEDKATGRISLAITIK